MKKALIFISFFFLFFLGENVEAQCSLTPILLPRPTNLSIYNEAGTTELTSPIQPQVVTVKWNASNGATSYYIEIDNLRNGWPGCSTPPPLNGDTCQVVKGTSYKWNFLPNRDYEIRVRANDNCGNQSNWRRLTISILPRPTPTPTPTYIPGTTPTFTPTPTPTNTPTPTPTTGPTPTYNPAQNRRPSLFVVFDIKTYIDLLNKLSISTYDWQQQQ